MNLHHSPRILVLYTSSSSPLGPPLLRLGHLGEGGLVHQAHPPQLLVEVLLQPHRTLVLLRVLLVVLRTDRSVEDFFKIGLLHLFYLDAV